MHLTRESPADLDALATALISQGSRFARTASRRASTRLSLVAMRILVNLQQDGRLRVGELALREGIAQPAMTATVNRLQRHGMVTRDADPADARAALVGLTPAGAAELAVFRRQAASRVRPLLEALDEVELTVLDDAAVLLQRLADEMSRR